MTFQQITPPIFTIEWTKIASAFRWNWQSFIFNDLHTICAVHLCVNERIQVGDEISMAVLHSVSFPVIYAEVLIYIGIQVSIVRIYWPDFEVSGAPSPYL